MTQYVFRVDASVQAGTGHVMRCLSLADAVAANGAQCEFICREHPGHLIEYIRSRSYAVHALPMTGEVDTDLVHGAWLGATQVQDAQACATLLAKLRPDWLVVDHYALDARWESRLAPYCGQTMVIDDLADRPHACQILLDQKFAQAAADYRQLVPSDCTLLCGSNYALLRPEFAALRPYSLERRVRPHLKKVLITMGGMDKDNITSQVLTALRINPLPVDCEITVVMGLTAPSLNDVLDTSKSMPWPTTVRVGVSNMAQLMADSDLSIGGAGATTWERCCLGLPTIVVVLAENQRSIAQSLSDVGAAILCAGNNLQDSLSLSTRALDTRKLLELSQSAAAITDGLGTVRVAASLFGKANYAN